MRQKPHVRICGGPGRAISPVYPTPIPGNFRTTSGLLGEVAFPHLCDLPEPRPQPPRSSPYPLTCGVA